SMRIIRRNTWWPAGISPWSNCPDTRVRFRFRWTTGSASACSPAWPVLSKSPGTVASPWTSASEKPCWFRRPAPIPNCRRPHPDRRCWPASCPRWRKMFSPPCAPAAMQTRTSANWEAWKAWPETEKATCGCGWPLSAFVSDPEPVQGPGSATNSDCARILRAVGLEQNLEIEPADDAEGTAGGFDDYAGQNGKVQSESGRHHDMIEQGDFRLEPAENRYFDIVIGQRQLGEDTANREIGVQGTPIVQMAQEERRAGNLELGIVVGIIAIDFESHADIQQIGADAEPAGHLAQVGIVAHAFQLGMGGGREADHERCDFRKFNHLKNSPD